MARVFAYLRVSTAGQTTENQKSQIAAAGIEVAEFRIMAETVSASKPEIHGLAVKASGKQMNRPFATPCRGGSNADGIVIRCAVYVCLLQGTDWRSRIICQCRALVTASRRTFYFRSGFREPSHDSTSR